jgi:8-oxo-dGTP pyrophosphatase MutT (NUDIX family)
MANEAAIHSNPPGDAIWRPDATVATIVERDGRFLFVEERVRGRLVLNQPAGHLEPGESLVDAAARETLEETGWVVRPHCLVGIYQWTSPDDGAAVLRFAFGAEVVEQRTGAVLDHGIERVLWLARDELESRRAQARSPLVARGVDDWLAGRRIPLQALQCVPSE